MASLYRRTILASDSGVATVCRIPLLLTVTAWTLTWAGAPVWWRAMLIAAATLLAATYWLPADCTAWSSRMMILRSSTHTRILLASRFGSFRRLAPSVSHSESLVHFVRIVRSEGVGVAKGASRPIMATRSSTFCEFAAFASRRLAFSARRSLLSC